MADDGLRVNADNTEAWLAAVAPALARGLEQVGMAAEGHAKAKCPVDTGRLRNSITHVQLDTHHEAIGTNVEYARYVELGTSRARAQPYLTPAATGHSAEYRAIMEAALGKS
ncbi:MAG: HK97-gp10 family putative phage morphogenesis protein [Parafannyhessea sp.]|uniref:HK97-gp10 family putative phage morphogenesis protein n=1 Tax=Parafannyhessea sp. TaxID=2847324 RepID=UPI003F0D6D05